MKIISILSINLFILFIVASCSKGIIGSGPIVNEIRSVNEFHRISNAGSANIHLIAGTEYKVEIRAQKNVIPYIESSIIGDELVIQVKDRTNIISSKGIEVYITCPSYRALSIDGSGNIYSDISPNDISLKLIISGSGNIYNANVNTQNLETKIAGSGNIEVKGSCTNETAEIAGSGDIKSYEMTSENCHASIEGSGSIYVRVNTSLDASIDGSGSIYYKGNPTLNSNINGSGRIKKVN